MTLPPPIEDDDERFAALARVGDEVVDFALLLEDERDEDDRTGGAGGPPVSLTWSLDGDDVELATVVVEDADVVSASSPLSQNSMRMMARQTSPTIPATMAYTRADWTVP